MISIKKIKILSIIVQSVVCFGKSDEMYESIKREYQSHCFQWNSILEKNRTQIIPSKGFVYLFIGWYLRDLARASITIPPLQGIKDDCIAMPTCHSGIFGCCVFVATGLCLIADTIFGGKRNEQDVICNNCELFKTQNDKFQDFQTKIQKINVIDLKMNRLLEKTEKTRLEWQQKLEACQKN